MNVTFKGGRLGFCRLAACLCFGKWKEAPRLRAQAEQWKRGREGEIWKEVKEGGKHVCLHICANVRVLRGFPAAASESRWSYGADKHTITRTPAALLAVPLASAFYRFPSVFIDPSDIKSDVLVVVALSVFCLLLSFRPSVPTSCVLT